MQVAFVLCIIVPLKTLCRLLLYVLMVSLCRITWWSGQMIFLSVVCLVSAFPPTRSIAKMAYDEKVMSLKTEASISGWRYEVKVSENPALFNWGV